MKLTKHGKRRLRGRLGLSGGAPERMAARALERGIPVEETTGLLRDWLSAKLTTHEGKASNARVYGEAAYMFHEDLLITVMHLPHELRPIARSIARRRREVAA